MARIKRRLAGTLVAFAAASLGLMGVARADGNPPTAKQPKELVLDCGNGAGLKLVLIPAGEFLMGGDEPPEQVVRKCGERLANVGWFQNEQPQHRVKITKPFYMGVYAVTQAQYQALMGNNPSEFKGETNPVERVSWNDAVEFCKRLSAKTGQNVRLPTEAEWEYACRAGSNALFVISNDPEDLAKIANVADARLKEKFSNFDCIKGDDGFVYTAPVGSFAPNPWGLHDMIGNVWEWCADWYDYKYYASSPAADPPGASRGSHRLFRGGSWGGDAGYCRPADRNLFAPGRRNSALGFRVAAVQE